MPPWNRRQERPLIGWTSQRSRAEIGDEAQPSGDLLTSLYRLRVRLVCAMYSSSPAYKLLRFDSAHHQMLAIMPANTSSYPRRMTLAEQPRSLWLISD